METFIVKRKDEKLFLFKGNEEIGQISPDATWVKEGDEFEESGIDHGGWVDEDLKTILIKIKGPCGHFH